MISDKINNVEYIKDNSNNSYELKKQYNKIKKTKHDIYKIIESSINIDPTEKELLEKYKYSKKVLKDKFEFEYNTLRTLDDIKKMRDMHELDNYLNINLANIIKSYRNVLILFEEDLYLNKKYLDLSKLITLLKNINIDRATKIEDGKKANCIFEYSDVITSSNIEEKIYNPNKIIIQIKRDIEEEEFIELLRNCLIEIILKDEYNNVTKDDIDNYKKDIKYNMNNYINEYKNTEACKKIIRRK